MITRDMLTGTSFVAFGLLAGMLHFGLLRWNTTFYARAGRIGTGVALQFVRVGILGALLAAAARYGALPLLLTALGVLIARPVVMRLMAAAP
ncbi:MAG TPA: ATP synthase subunit I [Rhodopila sp.]